jgi:HK97 family phage prohead protease
MEYLNIPIQLETKAFGDAGSFEGYAGIFGNVDLGGDVLERSAVKEIVKNRNGMVTVLNQHNLRDPIGGAEIKIDDVGIHVKGQLVLEVPSARNTYALMKADVLNGMSFGYNVLAGGAEVLRSGVRQLKAIKLFEVSPVTFGMNPLAGVTGVKGVATIREFEDFLRDVGGFSQSEAKALASGGYKALQQARDVSGGDPVAKDLADLIGTMRAAGM